MSPSRRRAIGAVRGFAYRAIPALAPSPAPYRPQFPPRHYARALPGRRDRDIAPYRHYTHNIRTAIPHAHAPPRRAPRSCPVAVGRGAWLCPRSTRPRAPSPRHRLQWLTTAVRGLASSTR